MNRLTICILALLASSNTPALAQRFTIDPAGSAVWNAARDDVRRQQSQNQQMRKSQQEFLAKERQIIAAAAEEVSAAKVAHRQSIKDLKEAREKAAESVERSVGLKSAIEDVLRAQTNYRELSEPVLKALKASAEFQEAEKTAAAAKEKIKRLQADPQLDDATRKERMAELMSATLAASNLERIALRKDPKVNEAWERLEAAQQKVVVLRKAAAEKAENDPAVAAAQAAVKTAFEAVKGAETRLASARSGGATQQILFGDGGSAKTGQAAPGGKK